MTAKKSDLCPLCGQFMDLIITSCRNSPFVDDKCYDKMCFGCFHVPMDEIINYNRDGSVGETTPVWDHKHLNSPQNLIDWGICDNIAQARKCISAVKDAIKKAKLTGRKKPKSKKRPVQITVLNEPKLETKTRKNKKRS